MKSQQHSQRNTPVARNNLFYDANSLLFEMEMGMNYLEHHANQIAILFQVDLEKSNLDEFYNESPKNNLVFKAPVELHCVYKIEPSELKSYSSSNSLGLYQKPGKLEIYVYDAVLKECNAEIKIGDYVGIQVTNGHMEYFVVSNDGRVNYDNRHSIYGVKPLWRTIVAAPIDENEFNGK